MNWKGVLKTAAYYSAAAVLSVAIVIGIFRLWRMDLRHGFFYQYDGLLMLVWTKSTIDTGWYLDNDRMGAPGAMDNRAFPIAESLHFAIIKGISLFDHDPVLVLNLYALLTFPLSALSSLFVFRRLGCSRTASMLGCQLFAFLPFHIMRIFSAGHIFLGSIYLIPLAVLVLLWVYLDEGIFFQRSEAGGTAKRRFFSGKSLGALVVSLLLSSAGIYYAFFYCFFLLIGSVRAAVTAKRWYPLITGAVLIMVTTIGLGANLAPSLIQQARLGPQLDSLKRKPEEAEHLGLRIIQLVHPVPDNRIAFLDKIKYRHIISVPFVNENDSIALGFIATAGFFALLFVLLWPAPMSRMSDILGALSRYNIFAVLLGTMGGLGALVSFSGFPWIRGYNRIAIYIGFFSVLAFVLIYDRLAARFAGSRWRWLPGAMVPLILLFGVYTQTGKGCKSRCEIDVDLFRSDRDFAQRMENALPPNSMVFQLPCVNYPESAIGMYIPGYEMAKPYIHTKTLRWSYGVFEQQEPMHWQEAVRDKPAEEMLTHLALADFKGVFIDRRCIPDHGQAFEAELQRLTKEAPLVSNNEELSFFNLCGFRETLLEKLGPSRYDRWRATALKPCLVRWGDDFYYREGAVGDFWRWGKPKCYLDITNPTDEPRLVTLRARAFSAFPQTAHLHIHSALFDDNVTINKDGTAWEQTLQMPPGTHRLEFDCDAACTRDHRNDLSFHLHNFHVSEFSLPANLGE